jgi:hypothetical protein
MIIEKGGNSHAMEARRRPGLHWRLFFGMETDYD